MLLVDVDRGKREGAALAHDAIPRVSESDSLDRSSYDADGSASLEYEEHVHR